MKISLYLKQLVFIPFVFIWLWLTDKGMVVIDPCSSTPGSNFTMGFILLALFPLIAGVLQYWSIRYSGFPKKVRCWISGLIPIICLIFSFLGIVVLLYAVEPHLSGTTLWSFFYETGCYYEPEVKSGVFFIFTSICYYLLSVLFLCICKKLSQK